ncbi:MAG TPA: NAD(P)/FAD-dependent oxidoreductase [Solirubrobacteraceae bacterium]|jgi:flavin-dependent dehydrogenase|nr:NAD(P)/FAD-dependent oxidoreductase [Solirubrobacteraceae bacterium]
MPVRATKRGVERTPLQRDCDVLVCGASFAGLAIARELADTGARVLVIDRYEIGERQTSACGIPTVWLEAMSLEGSLRQTFDELVVHTPWTTARWQLPWTFSTFDYRELCALLWGQAHPGDAEFETATVSGRDGNTVHTDRGDLTAPLIVDALGWRRVLSNNTPIQPPNARLSRGLEVHPHGAGEELELWIDQKYIRAGYAWSFPASDELRVGVGSFWPAHHVKEPTVRLAGDLGLPPEGYQGNWIPHQLRPAIEDGVFFVGDSAGHCLPLTAEGIRTALYFGLACARELAPVLAGHATREQALSRYGAFSDAHERKYRWLLNTQRAVGRLTPTRAITLLARTLASERVCAWSFNHYLEIAPPSFVAGGPGRDVRSPRARVATTTA